MSNEEKSFIGEIQEKNEKPYKDVNKGTYLNIKVGGLSFNVFSDSMKEVVQNINFGGKLKLIYTEKEGNTPGQIFKNLVGLEKYEDQGQILQEEHISDEPTKKTVEKAPVKTPSAPAIFDQDFWKNKFYDKTENGIDQHIGKCNHDAINIISSLITIGKVKIDTVTEKEGFAEALRLYSALSVELFRSDKEIRLQLKKEIDEIINEKVQK